VPFFMEYVLKHFTHNKVIERADLHRRMLANDTIELCELLYPAMQAFDSMVLCTAGGGGQARAEPESYLESFGLEEASCDVEVGGNDQTHNFRLTRDYMDAHGVRPELVFSTQMLPGRRAKLGQDAASTQLELAAGPGKVYRYLMGLDEGDVLEHLTLITDVPPAEIEEIAEEQRVSARQTHKDRMRLAGAAVELLYGEEAAEQAKAEFLSRKQGTPKPEEVYLGSRICQGEWMSVPALVALCGLARNRQDAEHLVCSGAIRVNGAVAASDSEVEVTDGLQIQRGKGQTLHAASKVVRFPEAVFLASSVVGIPLTARDVLVLARLAGTPDEARKMLEEGHLIIGGIPLREGSEVRISENTIVRWENRQDVKRVVLLVPGQQGRKSRPRNPVGTTGF
jgi:tyrosyl-tRNA synthetase